MTCEQCGVLLRVGDWPFCGAGRDHAPASTAIVRDEIPGGFVQENFGDRPETFYSLSAMRKRADQLGLQPFVRRLEQIKESDYIDAQTLANAAELVTRVSRGGKKPDDPCAITVTASIQDVSVW